MSNEDKLKLLRKLNLIFNLGGVGYAFVIMAFYLFLTRTYPNFVNAAVSAITLLLLIPTFFLIKKGNWFAKEFEKLQSKIKE